MFAKREALIALFMLAFILVFSTLTLTKPNYEWDLLPYVANAMQIAQERPIEQLHADAYEVVRATVPTAAYKELVGSPSRLVLSEDPEAFRQTMTFFYDARVIYNHIMAALFKSGLNPIFAHYFFSTLCSVISMLLLSRLIPKAAPIGMYFVLPFIVLSFGLMNVARLATPDALAALTTIGLYFILLRNKMNLLLILLPLVIFIRTDLILLLVLFHLYLFVTNRAAKNYVVVSFVATVACYGLLNNVIVTGDPWSSLIGYNFGVKPTHPQDYVFNMSVRDYLSFIMIGVMSFSYNSVFFVFCMLTVTGTVLLSARFFSNPHTHKITPLQADLLFVIASCVVYYVLHFLLFPVSWPRFFAAQYSLVAVVVSWTTFSLLTNQNSSTSA